MYQSDELQKKCQFLSIQIYLKLAMHIKRAVTATLLENQERSAKEQNAGSGGYQAPSLLGEAPTNAMGASSSTASDGAIDTFDPVLISLVRRSMPNLIAYDICVYNQ